MRRLDGRVAIVTGAGRGLGRAHSLALASLGARVVVNDLGSDVGGCGADPIPARQVVDEIRAAGGQAVASSHDVADWAQAKALVDLAIAAFSDLHVLVNNAGIVRDRTLGNLTEEEWDVVTRVHLKGYAAPTRHAMAYWMDRARTLGGVKASVVHTSSLAGLLGNFGQANYASAKLAVVALSRVAAMEGARYGVRSNVVSPLARTRIALSTPGVGDEIKSPPAGQFDQFDPGNVSPLIAWLAEERCAATSQIFHVSGDQLDVFSMPKVVHRIRTTGRWTLEALDRELPGRLVAPPTLDEFLRPWSGA